MKKTQANNITGISHLVEVGESNFRQRKYNIGRLYRSPLIVGAVDIHTGEMFFVEVINRNQHTLRNILFEKVHLGTTIGTDCWNGYLNLETLDYIYFKVNLSENFVDPTTGANTQTIEDR
ncbi:hypothetical protein H311_02254 [Anncaliia algerae PRA109]|nr:hypothetical protein H311_02254 [Anncaliia algerae PRA109]